MTRIVVIALAAATLWASAARSQTLEAGVVFTDPTVMAHLQATRFSAGAILFPRMAGSAQFKNDNLFKGPLQSVATELVKDIDELPLKTRDSASSEFFNDVDSKGHRFSARLLNGPKSSFILTGVVNRMDRAYRTVDGISLYPTCGEIRFIYRFAYDVTVDGRDVASRLPFTMSIVLATRDPDEKLSCADIAKRWQKAGTIKSVPELIDYLDSKAGPLSYILPSQLDRIEVNLQLFRVPAGAKTDFGGNAEYLLRIFRRLTPTAPFTVATLENQIDRDVLLANPAKLAAFKGWLLSKPAITALDRGLLDIRPEYLAVRAISVSPGSTSRTENQPFFGLLSDDEIQSALKKYATSIPLLTIKSVDAFKRRLNDLSCSGCHQTRAIAGFHFPGADPDTEPASNAVHVPGSAHFFADLPRRRAIIAAFASNTRPDFSRSFSARPDEKFRKALAGTQLLDGWGAICYVGSDLSFKNWTCAAGLECKSLDSTSISPGMGTCATENSTRVGDPMEFGKVDHAAYGDDSYKRIIPAGSTNPNNYVVPPAPTDRSDYVVAHQGFRKQDTTGGFPAGMLRIAGCANLPAEAVCGRVAADGFNDCVAAGKPFPVCLQHTRLAGLRACSSTNPCREDYICTAPYKDLGDNRNLGTCIPPYFMFQFRVDGHPESFVTQEQYQ